MSTDQQQPSNLDALLARSWASRAAISRQANLEPRAQEALRQNSEDARTERSILNSSSIPFYTTNAPNNNNNNSILNTPPPAPASQALQNSISNSISNPSNSSTGNPNLNVVGVSDTTGENIYGFDRGGGRSLGFGIGDSNTLPNNGGDLKTVSNNNNNYYSHTNNKYVQPQTESNYIVPATTALVDTSVSPCIPTNRGYRSFFREAAEEGGLAALHGNNSTPRRYASNNNTNTSTMQSPSSSGMCNSTRMGFGPDSKNYFPGQQLIPNSSASVVYDHRNNNNITIDSIEQIKVGQSPIQNVRRENNITTEKNRSLQNVMEHELVFLHQAYGDPTLSIITHWTLLHQNLALELLARHWMMLLDASRITSKHDRTLAAAATMQLKVSNNELSQVRDALATERAKNVALNGKHIEMTQQMVHVQRELQQYKQQHEINMMNNNGKHNNSNNNNSSLHQASSSTSSPGGGVVSSSSISPTRMLNQMGENDNNQLSPSRNSHVSLNPHLVSSTVNSRSGTPVISSALRRSENVNNSNEYYSNNNKQVSFAGPNLLPHPSQHVPLVWSSAVIRGGASPSLNNNNNQPSSPISIAKRNSPGRIQRRDMQF